MKKTFSFLTVLIGFFALMIGSAEVQDISGAILCIICTMPLVALALFCLVMSDKGNQKQHKG